MTLELCLYYGQSSHLAQSCLRQLGRSPTAVGAQTVIINNAGTDDEKTKNKVVVTLLPKGSTADYIIIFKKSLNKHQDKI